MPEFFMLHAPYKLDIVLLGNTLPSTESNWLFSACILSASLAHSVRKITRSKVRATAKKITNNLLKFYPQKQRRNEYIKCIEKQNKWSRYKYVEFFYCCMTSKTKQNDNSIEQTKP